MRSIRVRPATKSKRCDDSLVFVRGHGLVKVSKELETDTFEGEVIRCKPTNYPLPDLDFKQVYSYRVLPFRRADGRRPVTFDTSEVVGKGCLVKDYVSMVPIAVLRERS